VISEKSFHDVATEFGYMFASELASQKTSERNATAQPPSIRDADFHGKGSWSFNRTTHSGNSIRDFLSRCDAQGTSFFAALFHSQQAASKQTKITWDHESGFSMQFYFSRIGFVPMVWGFPAKNRDGRSIRERLDFPFDRAVKAGISEDFINEFGASLSALVPLSRGTKRPSVAVATLGSPEAEEILRAIFNFRREGCQDSRLIDESHIIGFTLLRLKMETLCIKTAP
jgi:hypothetical protein